MKKFSILALAAVGLLVAACSTKDVVEEGYQDVTKGKGQGFINVAISLPTQEGSSTRGWGETDGQGGNGQLDDGEDYEYSVSEVLLIIFGGESEATATVQQVESPTPGDWTGINDTPNQVTTRKNYVVKLDEDATGPFWILAVVNGNGVIGKYDSKNISINGVKKEGAKLSDLQGGIAEFMSGEDGAKGLTKFANAATNGSFFMTNAVLSKTVSGTNGINYRKDATVLAPVTKVFVSQSEAENGNGTPSADIYVERGLAKVTVSGTIAFDNAIKMSTGSLATPTYSWVLDNTNRTSYIVRKVNEGDWGLRSQSPSAARDIYRFVGYNNVDIAQVPITTAYRTYWSPDPNYSSDYSATNFFEPVPKTFPADASKPQYCFENTFDVDHQSYKNTTRVVVAANLNNSTTFYTLGDDRKTLYTETDIKKAVYARIIQEPEFQTWILANIKTGTTIDENIFASLDWSYAADKAGGIHATDVTIKADALTSNTATKLSEITNGNAILRSANAMAGKINRYVNGIAYYAIRIKHFGDDLTPWNVDEYGDNTRPAEPGINDIYPPGDNRDANYLGRYGVLRNNWYQLSLGTILKIGHPIVPWLNPDNKPTDPKNPEDPTDPTPPNEPTDPDPENPDHPDDSLDDIYLNARINILSWALRPQSWSLK